jgi:hypothetical protein
MKIECHMIRLFFGFLWLFRFPRDEKIQEIAISYCVYTKTPQKMDKTLGKHWNLKETKKQASLPQVISRIIIHLLTKFEYIIDTKNKPSITESDKQITQGIFVLRYFDFLEKSIRSWDLMKKICFNLQISFVHILVKLSMLSLEILWLNELLCNKDAILNKSAIFATPSSDLYPDSLKMSWQETRKYQKYS